MKIEIEVTKEEFLSVLFQSRDKAHLLHLKTTSLAHAALGEFYESIIDKVDGLIETYQGKYGIIELELYKCKTEESISYFEKLASYVEDNRKLFEDSYLQNQIDGILESIYKVLFKLKNVDNKV